MRQQLGAGAELTMWNFACPDWIERLRSGRSLVPDLPIDQAEGERGVQIFNMLRLPDVPGQPAMAEAAGEWFRDIVRAACGSLDKATGVRAISEIFTLVPKKNSKTTGGAAIALVLMLANERPRAEMLFVGPTQDVADLAFQQAAGMIAADPDGYLQKRFHVQEHLKTIKDRRNGAMLKIKTFDMRVMTGVKPVCVIVDELHVMSAFSYASRVVGQIRGGLLPNPESLLIFITTQSDEAPAGVFKAELQYARGIRDGRIKEGVRMLPILYEFPEAMQIDPARPWRDPANWPMVLPNLGLSITIDRLVSDYQQAREKGEAEERRWASQHLNVEIGLALHSDRWRGTDFWLGAADRTLTLDELLARSEVVTVGIDGGGLDDLLGLAVLGRCRQTRDWLLWNHAWCQEDVLELRQDIAERLRDFANDGDLTFCADAAQDLIEVADIIERIRDAELLPAEAGVGLDPAGVAMLVDEIVSRKIADGVLKAIGQGYRLSPAVWGMERKLKDGTLWHSGSALMSWCVGNAKAEQRGNAVLITKQTAGKAKIDPLIATFNAFQLMSLNPEAARALTSPWENPDFRMARA
ncbi:MULTISPECIES: terminase TerL endonuclease subunit [Rhodomicrobium]|uniref:terminase large subunit n=1 Tax=Rhodomicrobium TaxID=1068 RepID=UPI001FD87319|nr:MULTISPECIES: terminase TerL endonuclease subunit [Rhodomicrobium]